jgi:hypothetical protein
MRRPHRPRRRGGEARDHGQRRRVPGGTGSSGRRAWGEGRRDHAREMQDEAGRFG